MLEHAGWADMKRSATEDGRGAACAQINSYMEFAKEMLPRIRGLGYNTVQIMAVQEHAYYGSFGYHVTNYFAVRAPCDMSRVGMPMWWPQRPLHLSLLPSSIASMLTRCLMGALYVGTAVLAPSIHCTYEDHTVTEGCLF